MRRLCTVPPYVSLSDFSPLKNSHMVPVQLICCFTNISRRLEGPSRVFRLYVYLTLDYSLVGHSGRFSVAHNNHKSSATQSCQCMGSGVLYCSATQSRQCMGSAVLDCSATQSCQCYGQWCFRLQRYPVLPVYGQWCFRLD